MAALNMPSSSRPGAGRRAPAIHSRSVGLKARKQTGAAGPRSHFAITYICLIEGGPRPRTGGVGREKMAFRRSKGGDYATI
jgi:hypothetical protein